MASFPKEHDTLYFDNLIRTQKKESVLAFIMATYYAKKNNIEGNIKNDIYKRLEYAYGLFRDNVRGYDNGVGSYEGTDNQFSSQYTLGLEMGIWKNSKLDLNDLALEVATNKITITDYFDVVLLNYIQPINGKIVHPLYKILMYIKNNNGESIQKSEILNALDLPNNGNVDAVNALYNILIGTSYFIGDNNTLTLSNKYSLDNLISKCNKKYLGENGYINAKEELENNDEAYIEYLTSQNNEFLSEDEIASEIESEEKIEDRKNRFKKWLCDVKELKPNSIRNYSYYIKYIKKHGYTDYDLYTLSDISIIDDLLYKFNNDENYISWNKENRYTPSNALASYKEFLTYEFERLSKKYYVISIKDYSIIHKLYFDRYGYMYWDEGQNKKYNVGDIIYLYFSEDNGQEIMRIRKKALVTEINVPMQRLREEKYFENVGIEKTTEEGYFIKVKLVAETENEKLSYKNLNENYGFTVPQIGTSYIGNKDLIDFIENVFGNATEPEEKNYIIVNEVGRIGDGYNKIVYGIPGCGKSFHVAHTIIDEDDKRGKVFRTTFYPDYTNGDFVGQIIPKLNVKDEASVLYDIQSGPFTDALLDAILNPNKHTYLIIEEINRGNAAAIFGDIFQLLDRSDDTDAYYINNYIISTFLHKKIDNKYSVDYDLDNIKLPSNLILIGTMNTSDQNVFTLDTAFKRRWKMEYIKNDIFKSKFASETVPMSDVTWANFVNEINNYITSENGLGINGEDKQIGAYFISSSEWKDIKTTTDSKEAARIFAEKILSYIWDDVAKINRDAWFDIDKYKTLDSLVSSYTEKGLEVFCDNISFTREKQDKD